MRTSGDAAEIIRCARRMAVYEPPMALTFVWKELETEYNAVPQEARRLLLELQGFPTVSMREPKNLSKFARGCIEASELAKTKRGKSLEQLDLPDVQKNITSRLDEHLWNKWKFHFYEHSSLDPDKQVPFAKFSEWISKVAAVQNNPSLRLDTQLDTFVKSAHPSLHKTQWYHV